MNCISIRILHTSIWKPWKAWIWISRTRPVDVLPWVAIATVLCEWLLLVRFAGLRRRGKALGVVALANLASFAVPYAVHYLGYGIDGLDFPKFLDHWPSYTVGIAFVIATIAIELPVVAAVAAARRTLLPRNRWAGHRRSAGCRW